MNSTSTLWVIRYAFYAFIFAIPFETLDIGIERGVLSLSRIVGYLFFATALLQPQAWFKKPPMAFWCFVGYLFVYLAQGLFQPPQFRGLMITRFFMLVQMAVFLWISYNLLQNRDVIKGSFLALGGACLLLSILQVGGYASSAVDGQARVSALGENANTLGVVFSLGMLAFLGLAYGRAQVDRKISMLAWICFGSLAAGIVLTGSRTSALGLMVGILFLLLKKGHLSSKIKVAFIVVLAVSDLALISYQNESVRLRWEKTFTEGSLSGREEIIPEAWNMFTEKPLAGWGPVSHYFELGARFPEIGEPMLDTHNLYLWILTETGLLGALPFFIALVLCWRAAWQARHGPEGSFPMALLACVLIANMAGTMHNHKLFWLVLAYALASTTYRSTVQQWSPERAWRGEAGRESVQVCQTAMPS